MDNSQSQQESSNKVLIAFLWIFSLGVVSFVSFLAGKETKPSQQIVAQIVATPTLFTPQIATVTPQPTIDTSTLSPELEKKVCPKNGLSQKRDYLVSYIIKENDTLDKIAKNELGDATRINEIMILNGTSTPMVVGGVLYLPPSDIKQSSGNLKEISGMIVKNDVTSWQLSYGGGTKGIGIWIPGFWFNDVKDKDEYNIGDCISILLDDGYKVYSIKKNE